MDNNSKIFIAGHKGMVGSAIHRKLKKLNFINIITRDHKSLDLRNQSKVTNFFKKYQPDYVFMCAAKVGGIMANNNYPADFIYDNTMIEFNIIKNAFEYNTKKLMMLGSSCIYPKVCIQPIEEDYLMSGYLEPTNEAYAMAKLAGIKLCQSYNKQHNTNFISVMPCSLFGVNDNLNLEESHLIPALMRRMHEAKINNLGEVEIWGTGNPRREFLYVDDFAYAAIFLMANYNNSGIINVGSGTDYAISYIAEKIKTVVGYTGDLVYNTEKPDGTLQKLLDSSKVNSLGWTPNIKFYDGLKKLYRWYLKELRKYE